MTYIKTVDASGNLVSVRSVSDVPAGMEKFIPAVTLGADEAFITQDEFNACILQIRGET